MDDSSDGGLTDTDSNATGTDTINETAAGLKVCNESGETQSLSFGYEGAEG